MMCGHATATLAQNPVSFENRNMPQRFQKLTYMYANKARDFNFIATPWRWPTGSPALRSLIIRIKPMVGVSGEWKGGAEFDSIMRTAWDTVNNWGLRSGMNLPQVHSIVPFYAWKKPLEPGSATNARWGLEAIISEKTLLSVNQLWQTSRLDTGPPARDARSWKKGSLVRITYAEFHRGAGGNDKF